MSRLHSGVDESSGFLASSNLWLGEKSHVVLRLNRTSFSDFLISGCIFVGLKCSSWLFLSNGLCQSFQSTLALNSLTLFHNLTTFLLMDHFPFRWNFGWGYFLWNFHRKSHLRRLFSENHFKRILLFKLQICWKFLSVVTKDRFLNFKFWVVKNLCGPYLKSIILNNRRRDPTPLLYKLRT